MDGRERILRTLAFEGPDKIPVDLWILPASTDGVWGEAGEAAG